MTITYIGNFIDFLEFGLFTALLPYLSQDLLGHYSPALRAEFCYLAVFAGFIGRPVGAFCLGKFGDIYGSQRLLVFSVLGISGASMILAFLPSQNPYIIEMIIFCRFLQGLFTGAEYSAVVVSATQSTAVRSRYQSVAIMTASGILGVSTAQFLAFFLSFMETGVSNWRYTFILVSLIGFCTFLKRAFSCQKDLSPVVRSQPESLKKYIPDIVACIIIIGFVNAMFYFINTFISTYKMIISSKTATAEFLLNFVATSFFALSILLWSFYLSHKDFQIFKMMKYGMLGVCLLLIPLFYAYVEVLPLWVNIIAQISFIGGVQLCTVVAISFIPRLFPSSIKIQACGLGFNLGISLLGGGFPYVCLKLTEKMHTLYAPAIAAFLIIILAYYSLKKLAIRHPHIMKDRENPSYAAAYDKIVEKNLQCSYKQ